MTRKLTAVLLCLLLACAVTAAPAADTSRENCETQRLAGCNLLTLKTNQYAEGSVGAKRVPLARSTPSDT